LLHLLLVEVIGARGELQNVDIFIDKRVIVLKVERVLINFSDALVALGARRGEGSNGFLGNEGK